MEFNKVTFIIKSKLFYLSNERLVFSCLDKNLLISRLAIEELVRRNPISIDVEDSIISKIINKMTIEQVWEIVSCGDKTKLYELAYQKLKQILDYYDLYNQREDIREKIFSLNKKMPF